MIPIKDENPTTTFSFVTIALICINIAVFIGELSDPGMIKRWGLIPTRLSMEPQNTITSMFLHGGFLHIAGNMLYLWIFGNNIEDAFGHFKFILFYLFCGIVAALFHAVPNLSSSTPMVGASGAISGILGAYLVLYPWARVKALVFFFWLVRIVAVPAYFFIFFWFLWQILGLGMGGSGVAYLAHIGGFLAGFIIARIYKKKIETKLRRRYIKVVRVRYH